MQIRQLYLNRHSLEPPAVLLLPPGVGSTEKAHVYRGGLSRDELEPWLEQHALARSQVCCQPKIKI